MSSGTQVDLDWAGTDAGVGGVVAPAVNAPAGGTDRGAYLSDEEILGIEPLDERARAQRRASGHDAVVPFPGNAHGETSETSNRSAIDGAGNGKTARDSSGHDGPRNDSADKVAATSADQGIATTMPAWMQAAAADPQNAGEAQALWREHQEFRAAFASSEEARAIKELLPGGVKDVLSLREATQSVDRIDAALFSGDSRAQSEVVAELARTNPAAFRSMFAEAARVLAGMGQGQVAGDRGQGVGKFAGDSAAGDASEIVAAQNRRQDAGAANAANQASAVAHQQSAVTNQQTQVTSYDSPSSTPQFDPSAYAAFERATNDAVARDVRGSIGETLARVMPEGVAEGAARRIGEDIFSEVHRALAADRVLSEQVAAVLRDRRFGGAEQQRVAALLAGRAKQIVPGMARRVIGEWTSSVLSTARAKASRQAVAASRVDIAAPGGSADSMPLRAMSAREVNYASMSDEEILGL